GDAGRHGGGQRMKLPIRDASQKRFLEAVATCGGGPVFAPEGRPSIARGETPGHRPPMGKAPKGRPIQNRSPLRGSSNNNDGVQGFHPWLLTAAPPGRRPVHPIHSATSF